MKLFQAYLEVSIVSVMLITLGFCLFTVFSSRIPARYRKRIWLLLAVQLMIPVRFALPDAPVSLPAPDLAARVALFEAAAGQPFPRIPSNLMTASATQGTTLMQIGYRTWLLGAMGYALFHLGGYLFVRHKMMRWGTPVTEAGTVRLMAKLCEELNIHRRIQLRGNGELHGPLMMGLIRPVIMLPACHAPSFELDLVLRHELCHFRSRDIAYKLVMLLVRSLHWFNPAVHIMTRQAEVDLEFACDDSVIRSIGREHRMVYGETILSAAQGELKFTSALTTHLYSEKKNLIERMKNLMKTDNRSRGLLVVSVFLVMFISAGLFVRFASATEQDGEGTDSAHVRENYGFLLGLRVAGYQNMTVSEYRETSLQSMDQPDTYAEYAKELDQNDSYLWDYRYIDEDASFIMNTLIPIVAEKWTLWQYPNWVQNPVNNEPVIEYQMTRELLAPEKLTVGEYQRAVIGIMSDIKTLALNHSDGDQVDEAAILQGIKQLEFQYSDDVIRFDVEAFTYSYSQSDSPDEYNGSDDGMGEGKWTPASKADYDMVLALRYDGYQNASANSFTSHIEEGFNIDAAPINDAYERVYKDIVYGSSPSFVTETDLQFVNAVENSIREYVAEHQSRFAEQKLYPTFRGSYYGSDALPHGIAIEYDFRVEMLDGDSITVNERDRRIAAILNSADAYLRARDADAWEGGEQAFKEYFGSLCAQNSDSKMKCSPVKIYYNITPIGDEEPSESTE